MKIGILGGGLTGLTLGYFLEEKGIDFEILEKNSECGGLCKTIEKDGFTFDCYGGHIIFSKDDEVLNFMLSLLSKNINKCKRNTKILYNGKYVKYPFENGLDDLPNEEKLECLYHFIDALVKRNRDEFKEPSNFKEWVYQTFGKGIAEKYLIPYNEKIWRTNPGLLNLDWIKIKDRLPQPNTEDVIKSALGIETEGYLPQLFFYYPIYGGIQSLIKAIEDKIKNKIIKNFEIKKIMKNDRKWVISNGEEKREFDLLISTIPIIDLVETLNVSEEIRKTTSNLKYNSLITILIGLNIENLSNIHWLYIPNKKIRFHRVVFPKNNSIEMVPSGKSSAMTEITCKFGDEIWNKSDEELIKETIEQLHEIGIIDKTTVCFTKVKRTKYAYVIYDLGYPKNLETVKKFIENYGIELCGRFSEFKYLNMDACIRSAINMANKIKMMK